MVALLEPGGAAPRAATDALPDGAIGPGEVMKRARANVQHLNRHGELLVVGEVFESKVGRNGHLSFKLKDDARGQEAESLPCFMYFNDTKRVKFSVEQGMRVLCGGTVTVSQFANVQLVVKRIEPVGAGALEAAFQQLKERLGREGLFEAARKRALPFLPLCVGVVTSSHGAAQHDVLERLFERMPGLRVIVRPTKVQGDEAAADVAEAIRDLDKSALCDVILVVRGGGSLDDLWAFNTEPVVRAVANAKTPIVSGVGHESDITLCDLAADVRASTPTHAAELAVPHTRAALDDRTRTLARRLDDALAARANRARLRLSRVRERLAAGRNIVDVQRQRVARLVSRLERRHPSRVVAERRAHVAKMLQRLERRHPARTVDEQRARVAALGERLRPPVERRVAARKRDFGVLLAKLHALSPLAVLSRGYAVVTREDGKVVASTKDVREGDDLRVRVADGTIDVKVTK